MSVFSRAALLALLVLVSGCDATGGEQSVAYMLQEDTALNLLERVVKEAGEEPAFDDLEQRRTLFAPIDPVISSAIERSGLTEEEWYAQTDLEALTVGHTRKGVVGWATFEPGVEIKMSSGAIYTVVPGTGLVQWGLDSDDPGDEPDALIISVIPADNGRIVKLNRMLAF